MQTRLVTIGVLLLGGAAHATDVRVGSPAELASAIANAKPTDVITVADGTYNVDYGFVCAASSDTEPMTIRAADAHQVKLIASAKVDTMFRITGAKWIIDGIDISGGNNGYLVGAGGYKTTILRSRITDAAVAGVAASCAAGPSGGSGCQLGVVAGCQISRSVPSTSCNVAAIDLAAAQQWALQGNTLSDITPDALQCPAGVGFGIVLRAGTQGVVVDGNSIARTTTALSIGGSAPSMTACEDQASILRNNVIVGSLAAGVVMAQACGSHFRNNTVWNSATAMGGSIALDVRLPRASPDLSNNIVSAAIRDLDGAVHTGRANLLLPTPTDGANFLDAAGGDFRLVATSAAVDTGVAVADVTADFDGVPRPQGAAYDVGAFERPPLGYADGGVPLVGDGGSDLGYSAGGPADAALSGGIGGGGGGLAPPRGCACDLGTRPANVPPALLLLVVVALCAGRRRRPR